MITINTTKAKIAFVYTKVDQYTLDRRNKDCVVLGYLSTITDFQAAEVVRPEFMDSDNPYMGEFIPIQPTVLLKELARSCGIEDKDFDKYLVIRL